MLGRYILFCCPILRGKSGGGILFYDSRIVLPTVRILCFFWMEKSGVVYFILLLCLKGKVQVR